MLTRIYEIQADEVHKKSTEEKKPHPDKLFTKREAISHKPIRLKSYINESKENKKEESGCKCLIM